MKISIIMGRGIEGCGVTKFTLEQMKWLKKHKHDFVAFASRDKSWTRKNAHDTQGITELKLSKKEEVDNMIHASNECDIVIVNSLPPESYSDEAVQGFSRALNEIKKPIVLIQHDHSMQSIRRNACMDESIQRADIIFAHSVTNDFAQYATKIRGGGLSNFIDDNPFEVLGFQPGMYFDPVKEKYWKADIKTQDAKHNKWIGRTTSWKGYKEMFDFHNNFLRKAGYLTTFEGIERSPAYLGFQELSDFHGLINENVSTVDLSKGYGDLVYVFGPYVNSEMLERMSRVGFGYQLSLLKPHFIERSIEYTHCELACTGTIPVFRKKYGQLCKHRHYKKPLIDCKNNGTVWLDEENMAETLETIKALEKDPGMREEWRNNAFEFYKLHQDAEYTFAEMMKRIKEKL